MCGINGIIFSNCDRLDEIEDKIQIMNNSIIHRGPDDSGKFVFQKNNYSCALGMRRLSIIDLDLGSQPIYSEDGSLVIVFNGEIYNYLNLKNSLVNQGVIFHTNSDTEVILKLYQLYGTNSFAKLDGMFAFSIYDKKKNKVFIARDFFGEKPLYYSNYDNCFVWSSELKSLKLVLPNTPVINKIGLSVYFQLTYIPAPFTIFEGIHKLEANSFIEINCIDSSFCIYEIKRERVEFEVNSKVDAIKITKELVSESVHSRSVSDVPIGTFLSGGVDSSIVSLCLAQQQLRKIDTFSVGFENKSFDESEKSRLVSKLINSNHHEFVISQKDLSANIDDIILNFDEPFADSSALATYLVSKKTKDFVKVALTGDGGDEVFGGYNKYYMGILNQKYTSIISKKMHFSTLQILDKLLATEGDSRGIRFKIKRLLHSIDYEGDFYFNIISLGFTETELNYIFKPNFNHLSSLKFFKDKFVNNTNSISSFRAIDKELSLEGDMLVKVDRTSMLASLECRAPFLNKELWDFSNQLPDSYLINGWDKKFILKEAFKKYFPKDFLNKSKRGFGVPVGDWLRNELKQELLFYTEKNLIDKQGIFEFATISNLVNNHLSGNLDNTFRVWTFYCFQKWYINNYFK